MKSNTLRDLTNRYLAKWFENKYDMPMHVALDYNSLHWETYQQIIDAYIDGFEDHFWLDDGDDLLDE